MQRQFDAEKTRLGRGNALVLLWLQVPDESGGDVRNVTHGGESFSSAFEPSQLTEVDITKTPRAFKNWKHVKREEVSG